MKGMMDDLVFDRVEWRGRTQKPIPNRLDLVVVLKMMNACVLGRLVNIKEDGQYTRFRDATWVGSGLVKFITNRTTHIDPTNPNFPNYPRY